MINFVEHAHCGFDVRYKYTALAWAAAVESYKVHNQLMQHPPTAEAQSDCCPGFGTNQSSDIVG